MLNLKNADRVKFITKGMAYENSYKCESFYIFLSAWYYAVAPRVFAFLMYMLLLVLSVKRYGPGI